MATPRLVNAFDAPTYQAMVRKRILASSTIFNSGAVLQTAEYNDLAAGSGTKAILPWVGDLSGSPEIGALDASIMGAVAPLTMGTMTSNKDFLSKSWGISNLEARIAGLAGVFTGGNNVMGGAADQTAQFWNRGYEELLIAKLTGVIADNIANDGSDMVVKVGNDATGAVADAQKISQFSIIDAQLTMGDRFDDLTLVVMHTVVYGTLLKQDATQFTQPSALEPFRRYRGVPVIITDNPRMATQGTNRKMFNTYFLGAGVVLFGSKEGIAGENVIDRQEHTANNMGSLDLITRQHLYMHIAGMTVLNPTIKTGYASPEFAEYEKASTWDRVGNRKDIKLAVLQSNG